MLKSNRVQPVVSSKEVAQLRSLTGGNLQSPGMIIRLFVLLKESNYRHVKKGKHSPRNSSSHASQEAPGPLKIP